MAQTKKGNRLFGSGDGKAKMQNALITKNGARYFFAQNAPQNAKSGNSSAKCPKRAHTGHFSRAFDRRFVAK